nr:MAG TPA: hypothetical protein [Caudoviricetes sp.]
MKNENPISIFGKIPFWRLFLTRSLLEIWKILDCYALKIVRLVVKSSLHM